LPAENSCRITTPSADNRVGVFVYETCHYLCEWSDGLETADLKDLHPDDLIIAADGRTRRVNPIGITPNVIIRDFDSVDLNDIIYCQQAGVETTRYLLAKMKSDLELALVFALKSQGYPYIHRGALVTVDMTIANVLLAVHIRFSQLSIRLLDGLTEFAVLRGESHVDINDRSGDTLSLIPIGGDAHGITTHGLVYPLADETLFFGSSRGVSNIIISKAQVIIRAGILLVCISGKEV
jgi:thiamine pyrophosphokinase